MSLRDSLEDRFISGDPADASSVPSIDWSGLGLGILGSAFLASVLGFAESILSTGAWVVAQLLNLAAWFDALGASFGSAASAGESTAVGSWSSFAGALGPAALPVGVAIAFAMIYVSYWVISRVR